MRPRLIPVRKLRFGVLFHGNKIWISELLSYAFTTCILTLLLSITFLIFFNEYRIHKLDKRIASLKSQKIVVDYKLTETKEQAKLADLLCRFAGKRVEKRTVMRLAQLVHANSKQFGYDPLLLLSVIQVESLFKTNALGKYRSGELSGAMGLMQLKLETAQEIAKSLDLGTLSREDLFKPEINLVLGVAYLTKLIQRFKSFKLGLLAYNQGPGIIKQSLANRTQLSINYYNKVLKTYYSLQKIAQQTEAEANTTLCF